MNDNLKIYFSRPEIIFYSVLGIALLTYSIIQDYFFQYWYFSIILILVSPFMEYFTHLYFLHLPMPKTTETKLQKYYALFLQNIHHYHHKDPKNVDFIFAQIWLTLPALFFDTAFVYFFSRSVAITTVVITFMVFYYLFYELCHFTAHSSYTPKTKYFQYMKKYHILHHYKNENYWYGITSPLGDHIFGRYRNPDYVDKSLTAKKQF